MTIKELCQIQHVKVCHICDDWACDDNTNPLKKLKEAYEKHKKAYCPPAMGLKLYDHRTAAKELMQAIREVLERENTKKEDIACPFCMESGFDVARLKNHITYYCDNFHETIDLPDRRRDE